MWKREKSCKSLTYRILSNALQDGLEPTTPWLTDFIPYAHRTLIFSTLLNTYDNQRSTIDQHHWKSVTNLMILLDFIMLSALKKWKANKLIIYHRFLANVCYSISEFVRKRKVAHHKRFLLLRCTTYYLWCSPFVIIRFWQIQIGLFAKISNKVQIWCISVFLDNCFVNRLIPLNEIFLYWFFWFYIVKTQP